MNETNLWINDQIGLRKLNDEGKMYLRHVPNADHLQFNKTQVVKEFIPFLYEKDWAVEPQNHHI